jgi:glycine dehydrogenase subunit 1
MAAQNVAKARFAADLLTKVPGVKLAFSGPVFNEFVIEFPRSVKIVNTSLKREKIIGPLPVGGWYPELSKRGLVCVTETTSREEIEKFAAAVGRALAEPL